MATRTKELTLKVLILTLKNLSLALSLERVVKVIRTPEIFRSGQRGLGVTHFEREMIILVDVHQQIYGQPHPELEEYLVLIQANDAQLYGIPAAILPTMKEFSKSALKALPSDFRDRDPLGIASHTITIFQGETQQTVFLLDLARLCHPGFPTI